VWPPLSLGAIEATYWCFRRARFSAEDALVRVLGFNTLLYVPFALGAWACALCAATGVWGDESLAVTLPWLLLVPFCFLAAVYVTQPGRRERPTDTGGGFARRALAYAIAGTAWVREVLAGPGSRRLVVSSALYWVGNAVCRWAALRSVGETLPVPELVLAFSIGQVAMLLPPPLGGVGGVDAGSRLQRLRAEPAVT
jgi:uncharacterized membrane protein YbhN (UPF0104 family)